MSKAVAEFSIPVPVTRVEIDEDRICFYAEGFADTDEPVLVVMHERRMGMTLDVGTWAAHGPWKVEE